MRRWQWVIEIGLPVYLTLGSVSTLCFNFAYKSTSSHGSCHSPGGTNRLCEPFSPSEEPGCPCSRPGPTQRGHGTCLGCCQSAAWKLLPFCSGAAFKLQPLALALSWALLQLWPHWSCCTVLAPPQTCLLSMDLSVSQPTGGWTGFLSPDLTLVLWDCAPCLWQCLCLPWLPACLPLQSSLLFLLPDYSCINMEFKRAAFFGILNFAPKTNDTQWKSPSIFLSILQNVKKIYRWILNSMLKE